MTTETGFPDGSSRKQLGQRVDELVDLDFRVLQAGRSDAGSESQQAQTIPIREVFVDDPSRCNHGLGTGVGGRRDLMSSNSPRVNIATIR